MKDYLYSALERDLVINAAAHPEWNRALNSTRYRGELATVLPSIYSLKADRLDFATRIAALRSADRGYVVTGAAAARLTWWPDLDCGDIGVAFPGEVAPSAGFVFEQRRIRDELLISLDSLFVTTPPLTVLDLVPTIGSVAVDEALRRRVVTLGELQATLGMTPKRRGNQLRREILKDSRDQPWSPLERSGHRVLREAGLRGWLTNFCLILDGIVHYIDVAFPEAKLAVELDGFAYHSTRQAFHDDRLRDARLAAHGWHTLHFTTETLHAMPDAIRSSLRGRRR